ncbi:MAG: AAC(3) family N-acetyltransferase [Gemmatimonadaceae bacterium]
MRAQDFAKPRAWLGLLPTETQEVIKAAARKVRERAFRIVYAYGPTQLEAKLRSLGIKEGDSLLMQSSFSNLNGFSGDAVDVLDCVQKVLGPDGNLFMVSMPYGGSARDYLNERKPFNVRRTPSQMGLLSELFRRRESVLRSANPLHPILAYGPRAEWLVAGHEDLQHSCGENSPFERMLELDTKALLFDVDLDVLTFMHYLEHMFRDTAPVDVYTPEPMAASIIGRDGVHKDITVYAFASEAMKLRNFGVVYDEALRRGWVQAARVGNTSLQVVRLQDVMAAGQALVTQGIHIFARPGEPTRVRPLRNRAFRRPRRKRKD